jgi:hypothetical protein
MGMMHARLAEHSAERLHGSYREGHRPLPAYSPRGGPQSSTFEAYVQDLPTDLLAQIGHDFNVVIVQQVMRRALSADAGVQANDVLVALEGVRVVSAMDLVIRLRERAGKTVTLSVLRGGERHDVSLTPAVLTDTAQASAGSNATGAASWLATRADWSRSRDFVLANGDWVPACQRVGEAWQIGYERTRAQARCKQAVPLPGEGPSTHYDPISRRGDASSAVPCCEEMARDRERFNEGMERYWVHRGKVRKNRIVELWSERCPQIYSQLFAFPRPKASLTAPVTEPGLRQSSRGSRVALDPSSGPGPALARAPNPAIRYEVRSNLTNC